MKKKKELSTEEAFANLYVSTLNHVHDSTLLTIKFYENKCSILKYEINNLKNKEPFKLFKISHRKWRTSLESLKTDYENAAKNLMIEYKELEGIIDLFNN